MTGQAPGCMIGEAYQRDVRVCARIVSGQAFDRSSEHPRGNIVETPKVATVAKAWNGDARCVTSLWLMTAIPQAHGISPSRMPTWWKTHLVLPQTKRTLTPFQAQPSHVIGPLPTGLENHY